jgi:hypothetical protein
MNGLSAEVLPLSGAGIFVSLMATVQRMPSNFSFDPETRKGGQGRVQFLAPLRAYGNQR